MKPGFQTQTYRGLQQVDVPAPPDRVWNTLKTMGPQDEGYGGYFLAAPGSIINGVLPEKFQSPPSGEISRRQLKLGNRFPDGHRGQGSQYDLSEVVELDDVARAIEFETKWTPSEQKTGRRLVPAAVTGGLAARFLTKESTSRRVKVVAPTIGVAIGAAAVWTKSRRGTQPKDEERLHYTTRFEVTPKLIEGQIIPGVLTITGTNRLANVKHTGVIASFLYPHADKFAMKKIAKEIGRHYTIEQ